MATSPCDGPEENAFAAQAGAALVPKERGPDLTPVPEVPEGRGRYSFNEL